ncbi:hypothetical protein A4R44_00820 [Amycolatopsis sp. M39]|nr:hypothetical protein A4R44_00820 [Amycolatopsis sp. M39]
MTSRTHAGVTVTSGVRASRATARYSANDVRRRRPDAAPVETPWSEAGFSGLSAAGDLTADVAGIGPIVAGRGWPAAPASAAGSGADGHPADSAADCAAPSLSRRSVTASAATNTTSGGTECNTTPAGLPAVNASHVFIT